MPRPFAAPGAPTNYLPDRPAAVEHVRLELDLDSVGRRLSGRSTLSLRARRDGVEAVELDAVDMQIGEVTVDGAAVTKHHYDGEKLRVPLPRPAARGARLTISVAYKCAPRRGLFFIGPDEHHPDRPLQCWTQGQDEDSRHYWPGIDMPIEKATSEVICTAPRGLFVLSNGELRERVDLPAKGQGQKEAEEDDGEAAGGEARTRWHYALDLPHAGYLVTLVCGAFAEVKDRAPDTGVDVYYYVPPGREDDARRSYGRTPQMIDYFSKQIGVRYPHRRYSQIVVEDFIFGGMENTTATTLTDLALLDARASLDHDVEGLVAHELAHQWWGNLLTCREWSEGWLNEGFATYFEYVWREFARGRDEADVEQLNDTEGYLNEAGKYQRPVVCRQYDAPIELFDAHLYEKGGRVLHMLRNTLGDEIFWRALRGYAEGHARRSVETRDLARAVEDASGRNLDAFFDQWIGRAGHPELEGSWRWDEAQKLGRLRLEQKQEGEAPFHFDMLLRLEIDGEVVDRTLEVRERSHVFEFSLAARPTQVVFDPGDIVLKTIKLDKSRPLWARQLVGAKLAVDRVLAARALADLPGPETARALATSLSHDPFWAVRAAAARALGQIRGPEARAALIAARGDAHPKVRRAVAGALGELRDDPEVAATLARWLEAGDDSYFVEATVALSLGKARAPQALALLPGLLARDSFQDVIRARAIEGLGATGDEAAIPIVEAALQPRASFQVRRAALAALTRLSEGTPFSKRARERLERGLDDVDFRVRNEAAAGLATLQDARAIGPLERAMRAELDGRTKRRLREAVVDLTERGRPAEQARKVGDEVQRLRGQLEEMRSRLEKLERGQSEPSGGGPRPRVRKRTTATGGRRQRPPSRRGGKPGRPPR